MQRKTGTYSNTVFDDETVRAFTPYALPPRNPPLRIEGKLAELHAEALAALKRLEVAGVMVPSSDWFLYGFIRKEAVVSSQIEGTQATLEDVISYEATRQSDQLADVEEICNYVESLTYARGEIVKPKGLPLCARLLCEIHKRLMKGVRGSDKQPGAVRTTQNWIGGSRPGTAKFVPPPPQNVPEAMAKLERWIHQKNSLAPLIRIGLIHVQFETIHPFLDGNGRIGRLLITLLVEHWELLSEPLLYLSLAFKKRQQEYCRRLSEVRTKGDWEGWTAFFLKCVYESAEDGVQTAQRLFNVLGRDRQKTVNHKLASIAAVRLFDLLPKHPIITLPKTIELLKTTKPTATKAINALYQAGVLRETTGKRRNRVYAYRDYLAILAENTDIIFE